MPPDLYSATMGAPTPSPNVLGASAYNEISNLGAIDRKLPTSTGLANVRLGEADQQVTAQKQAAALAAKKAEDQSDLSKYRAVKKGDGGYDFFDPDGNQVDIATVSQKTGAKPVDILYNQSLGTDSENPIDIQYREQKDNLEKYIAAKVGGNKKVADAYETSDPELKQYSGQGGAHQLIMDFQKAFQRYYVPRSQDPNAWGATNGSNFFSGNPDDGTGDNGLANGG